MGRMVSGTLSLIAGALGIGPALFIMYYTLAEYTYPKVERPFFDDRKVFMMLTLGLFLGIGMTIVRPYFYLGDAVIVIFYSLFLTLMMQVVLLMKRFTARLDTAFYGTSLGIGIGAMLAYQMGLIIFGGYAEGGSSTPWEAYIIALAISFQIVLITAVCSTLIGIGSARGKPWYFFGQALLLQITYNLLLLPLYQLGDDPLTYVTFVMATIFTLFTYWYIRAKSLPELVREAVYRMKKAGKVRKT